MPFAGTGRSFEELGRRTRSLAVRLRWLPPTIARLSVGWVFLRAGSGALRKLPGVVAYFESLGIPMPRFLAPLVAEVECVCGMLLIFGLGTRLAGLPLIVTMAVAILTAKRAEIHALSDLFGLPEYLYVLLCLWLSAYGAGPISLDRLFARHFDGRQSGAPPAIRL